ncbi:MAG TPA: hypothetical protein VI408_03655 [Gaiellaceae bacterium]
MATVGQVGQRLASELRDRVDELVSVVEDGAADFTEVATRADALGELADTIGEIYADLEQRVTRALNGDAPSQPQARPKAQAKPKDAQPEDESTTKEELLDRARELDVEGRSAMTKDELAEAVEAEESVTKEELLERAREAEIEGRSGMTKDELRQALHDANA